MKTVWTTKTGDKVKIKDMSDSHLINTIRMLHRGASETRSGVDFPDIFGDAAEFELSRVYNQIQDLTDEEICSSECDQYDSLVKELKRRNLKL